MRFACRRAGGSSPAPVCPAAGPVQAPAAALSAGDHLLTICSDAPPCLKPRCGRLSICRRAVSGEPHTTACNAAHTLRSCAMLQAPPQLPAAAAGVGITAVCSWRCTRERPSEALCSPRGMSGSLTASYSSHLAPRPISPERLTAAVCNGPMRCTDGQEFAQAHAPMI